MPTTQLKLNIEAWELQTHTLLALSCFFLEGGEQLPKQMASIIDVTEHLANYYNTKEFQKAKEYFLLSIKDSQIKNPSLGFEFNRLFVGPMPPAAPPYESVYLSSEHLVMQEQTLLIREIYSREKLQSITQGKEPDDFIATELEFLAYVVFQMLAAYRKDNEEQFKHYYELYQEFWNKHLDLWLEPFTQAIIQATNIPVFLGIAQLLRGLKICKSQINA